MKLRAACASVVLSKHMPLAHTGTILRLLDGPEDCDPGYCIVWCRFRMMRPFWAHCPTDVLRIVRLLHIVAG